MDIANLDKHAISRLGQAQFKAVMAQILTMQETDRKEYALYHYQPVSEHARQIHLSEAQTVGVGGGNGSSKTESCLVEMIMCATGIIPDSLRDEPGIRARMRGPINCRVVCESLTNVLHQIILPKLQWWQWTGIDEPGGKRGHYGWIPRDCLIGGSWDKSWSEKQRTLRLYYRDPDDETRVIGESKINFMSHDQDPTDFASGDYHMVLHDEPPRHAIWTENEARTMRVRGRMFLAMTWPDDPAIAVDWLFDEVYEPATRSNKDPNIDWINLYTTDNPNLDQEAIAMQMEKWDTETTKVRIYGQPIRFSNRVHALFTDQTQTWCFNCGRTVVAVDGKCTLCESSTLAEFNHVREFEAEPNWPTIWLLDPHPRKPHMYSWWMISPQDDLWCIAEGECDGDPTDVAVDVAEMESRLGLHVTYRFIDPNMGRSPCGSKRGVTWQDEFSAAGLYCDEADDSMDPGLKRIDTLLKPDRATLAPRIHIHPRCRNSIIQLKRYVWDDHKKSLEKPQKQKPKDKNNDFPTLLRYLANTEPRFDWASQGARVIRRMEGKNARAR